jgi:protein-S-isoprenylcysteine O-methyltransferase Ste14
MDRFRLTFIVLSLWLALLRGYYRVKGRGSVKERVPERWTLLAFILLGMPLILGVWLYIFNPKLLRPTTFAIAAGWRWLGAAIYALSVVLLTWVHVSLGKNFSSTLRIRSDQQLVTWGPYAYVRHPMYSAICLVVTGMALLSANWMIGAGGLVFVALIVWLRTPKEEEMMTRAFGEPYRQYAARTGRLIPRLRRRTAHGMGAAS